MASVREYDVRRLTDAYLDFLLQDLPSEAEIEQQQVLSSRFMRRMDRLVKREAHRVAYTWKRLFLVAAIIGLVLATSASVYANREAIGKFMTKAYERFTEIIFPQPLDSSINTHDGSVIPERQPGVIPQSYKVSERLNMKGLFRLTYTDEPGNVLLFTIQDKSGLQIGIDTEGTAFEELDIEGQKGIFYANKGYSNLVWEDEQYAYTITGKITKRALLDMAISTK